MVYLTNHSADTGIVLNLNDLGNLMKTECLKCALLVNRITNLTLDLLNLNCCHCSLLPNYPLNTLFREMPRSCATVKASRVSANAAIVAFTRL